MKKLIGLSIWLLIAAPAVAQQRFNNPNTTMVQGSAAVSSILTGIPGGTILTIRNTDGSATRVTADSAGTGVSSGFIGRSARGTVAAPTASQTDDVLLQVGAFGYGATAYSSTAQGGLLVRAGGNWTDASYPSYVSLLSTPAGATANIERLRVASDGTLQHFGTSSGSVTLAAQAAAGTPTLTWPTGTGTFAVSASSPITLSATTGALTCSTCGVTGSPLSQFAATTSAQLAGVMSDETGSNLLVFNTSPVFSTNITSAVVLGGAVAGSSLTLQSTSGAGGSTDEVKFLVGNNGGTNAGNVYGTGRWNIGATDVAPDSLMTIMANTAATVVPTAGTSLHIVGADATATRLLLDNFGSANVLNARHASGTLASKTGSASGSTLFAFGVAGWDGTSAYYSTASINFTSTETFSTTLGGSSINFNVTPNGTHSIAQAMTLHQSGGLSIGSTTDPGIGGLYVNGATITLNGLATDATHTDRTVCQDTTSKSLFFGSGAAGICLGTSSARFKHDIEPYAGGLDLISQLEPKTFRYREGHGDGGARQQFGLIAEDLAKIEPRFVGFDESGRPNSVDWPNVIWALVNATKELKSEIGQLKEFKRAFNFSLPCTPRDGNCYVTSTVPN